MKRIGLLIVGAIGGIAFVVACTSGGTSAGSTANASPSDCSVFQVASIDIPWVDGHPPDPPSVDKPFELPQGWEPLSFASGTVIARRCKP